MFPFNTSYLIIKPIVSGSFNSEWQNCLIQLIEITKDTKIRIFKINIFIHSVGNTDYQKKKEIISGSLCKNLGDECPTFGISSNSPELQFKVAVEIGIADTSDIVISNKTWQEWRYTIVETNGYKELWANGIESKIPGETIKSSSEKAFGIMHNILEAEKMTFNNIVRQWNYIGNILKLSNRDKHLIQHYQEFNKTRSDYYHKYRSASDFPAATGIGIKYGRVMIDFCAVSGLKEMQIKSISNPRQINPSRYDQKVLIGTADKEQKQPPLFERAKLIIYSDAMRLFVSGTASIIGQETAGIGRLEEQTLITIENISKLVGKKNLSIHCPEIYFDKQLLFRRIRVYVKNACDIPAVKLICADVYGNIPSTYIQADICRKDLLVEIEADLSS